MQQTPLYFVYGYLVSIGMVAVGAIWSFSPTTFVSIYRKVIPFERIAKGTEWEKTFKSTAGRVIGLLLAAWGLWIALLLSAQLIRVHYHLKEAGGQQTLSTKNKDRDGTP